MRSRRTNLKGVDMKRRYLVAVGVTLAVLAAVVLAGADSTVLRIAPKWEYAMYISRVGEDGQKRVSWFEGDRYVNNYSPFEFCRQMNIPASSKGVDEMALTPIYDLTVLDYLGQRGWELVSFPEKKDGATTYLFKRPRAS